MCEKKRGENLYCVAEELIQRNKRYDMLKNKKATTKDYPGIYLSNSNLILEQRISKQFNKSCYFRLTIHVRFYDFKFSRRKTLSPRIYVVFTPLARRNRITERCLSLLHATGGVVILTPLVVKHSSVKSKPIPLTGPGGRGFHISTQSRLIDGGEVVTLARWLPFTSRKISGTHLC
jgi:hypothetical protein